MRVIDVVEKFGEDAERFLKRMEKRVENGGKVSDEDIDMDEEKPNIILMGGDPDVDDGGIDPTKDEEEGSLDVIFPSDDEDTSDKKAPVGVDDDLTKALEQLDEEEDESMSAQDFGFDDGEIPTL